jgi:hypothetical protein
MKKEEGVKNLQKYSNNDPTLDIDGVLTFVIGGQSKSQDGSRTFPAKFGIGLGTWKNKQWCHITYRQAAKMLAFIKKNAEAFNSHLDKENEEESEILRAG